jgi:hypothetical protein
MHTSLLAYSTTGYSLCCWVCQPCSPRCHSLPCHLGSSAQVPIPEEEQAAAAAAAAADTAAKPTKLALGTEGGFAVEPQKDYTLDKTAELVVLQGPGQPRLRVVLPCADLPELVINVINAIQVGCVHHCRLMS